MISYKKCVESTKEKEKVTFSQYGRMKLSDGCKVVIASFNSKIYFTDFDGA